MTKPAFLEDLVAYASQGPRQVAIVQNALNGIARLRSYRDDTRARRAKFLKAEYDALVTAAVPGSDPEAVTKEFVTKLKDLDVTLDAELQAAADAVVTGFAAEHEALAAALEDEARPDYAERVAAARAARLAKSQEDAAARDAAAAQGETPANG